MKYEFLLGRTKLLYLLGAVALVAIKTFLFFELLSYYEDFYDLLQTGFGTADAFWEQIFHFLKIACSMMVIAIALEFVVSRYGLAVRKSIIEYYERRWDEVRSVENPDQRILQDSEKLYRYTITLGIPLLESIAFIFALTPKLMSYSKEVPETLVFGTWDGGIITAAFMAAMGATLISWLAGRSLPGKEYDIQVKEADYRAHLIAHKDKNNVGDTHGLQSRMLDSYVSIIWSYFKFNSVRWSLIQGTAIVAYVVLAPSIIAGTITFGTIIAIAKVFDKMETSFSFFLRNWDQIVALQSCTKRLDELETK